MGKRRRLTVQQNQQECLKFNLNKTSGTTADLRWRQTFICIYFGNLVYFQKFLVRKGERKENKKEEKAKRKRRRRRRRRRENEPAKIKRKEGSRWRQDGGRIRRHHRRSIDYC